MPTLFSLAEHVLTTADVENKLSLTQQAWQYHKQGELSLEPDESAALPTDAARFPGRPVLVDPRELPKHAGW
jgi:uncharacterized ferritin-like protein (DUF455 family)